MVFLNVYTQKRIRIWGISDALKPFCLLFTTSVKLADPLGLMDQLSGSMNLGIASGHTSRDKKGLGSKRLKRINMIIPIIRT
jgi:hypothetical protein